MPIGAPSDQISIKPVSTVDRPRRGGDFLISPDWLAAYFSIKQHGISMFFRAKNMTLVQCSNCKQFVFFEASRIFGGDSSARIAHLREMFVKICVCKLFAEIVNYLILNCQFRGATEPQPLVL